jgi:hypothetical protein
VPTREFDVPWSFDQCEQQVKNIATQVDSVDEIKRLHGVTNPLSERFYKDEYAKYLFDRMTARFFNFSFPHWLGGLDIAGCVCARAAIVMRQRASVVVVTPLVPTLLSPISLSSRSRRQYQSTSRRPKTRD